MRLTHILHFIVLNAMFCAPPKNEEKKHFCRFFTNALLFLFMRIIEKHSRIAEKYFPLLVVRLHIALSLSQGLSSINPLRLDVISRELSLNKTIYIVTEERQLKVKRSNDGRSIGIRKSTLLRQNLVWVLMGKKKDVAGSIKRSARRYIHVDCLLLVFLQTFLTFIVFSFSKQSKSKKYYYCFLSFPFRPSL